MIRALSSFGPIGAIADGKRTMERVLAKAGVGIEGRHPWDVRVHDPRFFDRVLREDYLGLGESYVDGWWDCERIDEMVCKVLRGDVEAQLRTDLPTILARLRVRYLNLQTVRRAPEVARAHYDLGNDFFERMLGPTMTYSCGYWRRAQTLEQAQDAKHELICRKLRLGPGDRLLDVGCGWGRLARHAAATTDCHVTGITVSERQQRYAEANRGALPIEFLLADYRSDAVRRRGPFQKIASVGMFEHVGKRNYRTFMEVAHGLLADDGLLLLHTIGNHPKTGVDVFVDRHLFPNSMLPSQADITAATDGLFVIEDWHNFGADYDRTLMAWHDNFERFAATREFPYDRRFYRMWRFYLASFAGTFRARNRMQTWQIVLSKNGVMGGYESVR